jgi:hypothetical protein
LGIQLATDQTGKVREARQMRLATQISIVQMARQHALHEMPSEMLIDMNQMADRQDLLQTPLATQISTTLMEVHQEFPKTLSEIQTFSDPMAVHHGAHGTHLAM